jgi:hypothetical protein
MAANPEDYRVQYNPHDRESDEDKVSRLHGAIAKMSQEATQGRNNGVPKKLAHDPETNINTNTFMKFQDARGQQPPQPAVMAPTRSEIDPKMQQIHSVKKAFANARVNPAEKKMDQERAQEAYRMWAIVQREKWQSTKTMLMIGGGVVLVAGIAYLGYTYFQDAGAKAANLAFMERYYASTLPPAAPPVPPV